MKRWYRTDYEVIDGVAKQLYARHTNPDWDDPARLHQVVSHWGDVFILGSFYTDEQVVVIDLFEEDPGDASLYISVFDWASK